MTNILEKLPYRELHYVIQPNEQLSALLESYSEVSFLKKRVLWSHRLYGLHSSGFSNDDEPLEVKLMFIARFKAQWRDTPDPQFKLFIEKLLIPPLGVSTFDKWWTLERIEPGDTLLAAANYIPLDILETLSETGNARTDEWIKWVIERRRNP